MKAIGILIVVFIVFLNSCLISNSRKYRRNDDEEQIQYLREWRGKTWKINARKLVVEAGFMIHIQEIPIVKK